jgi:hypothetical protein
VNHPKEKKTQNKVWKPNQASLPTGVQIEDVDRTGRLVQRILANGHANATELALLKQVKLLCLRTIAWQIKDPSLNELNEEISRLEKSLIRHYRFELNKDIIPLNLWITRKVALQKEGIEDLLRQVEEKMAKTAK